MYQVIFQSPQYLEIYSVACFKSLTIGNYGNPFQTSIEYFLVPPGDYLATRHV